MVRTRVGYAGGTTLNPTYYQIGDHSETVQIEYDPAVISYEQLLEVFWNSHNPAEQPWSRQYMSIIFYHDEEQKAAALKSMKLRESSSGHSILTEVVPFSRFYLAEDYHQKYYLQQENGILREFTSIYPKMDGLIRSTAAARVNGFIGGYGTLESLQKQINLFGLSPAVNEKLLKLVR